VGAKDSKRSRVIFNVQRALEAHQASNGDGVRRPRAGKPRAKRHAPLLQIKDRP
jgi:hypothetical protein